MDFGTLRRTAAPALVLTLGLTLGACGDDEDDDPDDRDETIGQAPAESGAGGTQGGGTAQDTTAQGLAAIATAEEETGGTAYAVDSPGLDGVWEVEVAVGRESHEVEIDETGAVVRTETDDLDRSDQRAIEDAELSLADAIQAVVDESGGSLDDADFDDDGRDHWTVTVLTGERREADYRVDMSSGEVSQERDDD